MNERKVLGVSSTDGSREKSGEEKRKKRYELLAIAEYMLSFYG
jgi:hypothetical protein